MVQSTQRVFESNAYFSRAKTSICSPGKVGPRIHKRHPRYITTAQLTVFTPADIQLESDLGTAGFVNVSSYTPPASGESLTGLEGLGLRDVQQLGEQNISEGAISCRLYTGKVVRGQLSGTRVTLKAYPSGRLREADAMAANELACHASLQPPAVPQQCDQLVKLLGGFVSESGASAGQQWLVFRNDGTFSAVAYAAEAAQACSRGASVGDGDFFDRFDASRPLSRRRGFILQMLRQTMQGLAFMHSRQRLHQSIGPASIALNRKDEINVRLLRARLKDFAFSVDVSDEALFGGATLGEIWERGSIASNPDPIRELAQGLWLRARRQGAYTERERRNYGIADDIYASGLLLAYMAFIPFCEPGSIDAASLQRLLESTFRLDIPAVREYCEADDRWHRAVDFLDIGGGAGWELLQAMLNPQWNLRPTADSCLNHPFLTGEAFQSSAVAQRASDGA